MEIKGLAGILALVALTQGYLILSFTAPFFSQNFPYHDAGEGAASG